MAYESCLRYGKRQEACVIVEHIISGLRPNSILLCQRGRAFNPAESKQDKGDDRATGRLSSDRRVEIGGLGVGGGGERTLMSF